MITPSYTDKQKLEFARKVLTAFPTDKRGWNYRAHLTDLLHYWGVFVPFEPRTMLADEGDIEYVESLCDQMRPYVFEWLVEYRFTAIEARIEALENSEAVEHGKLR